MIGGHLRSLLKMLSAYNNRNDDGVDMHSPSLQIQTRDLSFNLENAHGEIFTLAHEVADLGAPISVEFSYFHAVFGKIWPNNRLVSIPLGWRPSPPSRDTPTGIPTKSRIRRRNV